MLVIEADVTVPSGSVALTPALAAVPAVIERLVGQVGAIGALVPHEMAGDALFRGFAAAALKSEVLLSVSVQPFAVRSTAFVLLGAGVGAEPSKQFAVLPKPTKSMIETELGQAPLSAVVLFTNATLPAVAAMLMLPVASGVGRLVVPPPPAASWIK
jgi:O-acetyl-ADP-ribose deacetylase (regulator of RNase III)